MLKTNESAENYLETILVLSQKKPVVRGVDIAEELGFKKSSVSVAMKNLREKEQIRVTPEGYIYLTDSGKVIRKLRHNSVKKMRAKLRYWAKAYPKSEVDRDAVLASWQAWDAHAAHGNTWRLRQEIRQQVKEILKEDI